PFRTEKLSSLAQMVLLTVGEYVAAFFIKALYLMIKGFFYDQKSRNHTNVRDRAFRLRSKQANCLSAFIFNQKNKK
ncbi:MAG: hypothetical protein ABGW76_01860, partial [Mesonia sp.]|uniref:hypothetical protein n=1 Tax=Mesonia sp. TaxID=1960830 RepID=UPI0032429655